MSLCSTSSWSSAKPGIAPRNNRHLATLLYNSSPAKFQAQYDTAAPGRPGYGRVKVWGNALTYCIIIMRHDVLIFCCQYWNFSVCHNSASRSLKSWKNLLSNPHYICQNNCSWFKEKKLSQFCIPSKKLIGNHTQIYGVAIHVVCWGFCPSRNDVYCPVFVRPVLPEFRGAFPGLRFLSQ